MEKEIKKQNENKEKKAVGNNLYFVSLQLHLFLKSVIFSQATHV